MNNFYCYNPSKIIFGSGMISNIDREIPENSNILLIYGNNSAKRNGSLNETKKALKAHNIFEFSGVEANPEYETCLKIIKTIKSNDINFLVAIGGGSVIDATKFCSLASKYEGQNPWDFLVGKDKAPTEALPFGCIQTYPATGSEMNNAFVISRRETKEKQGGISFFTYPKFSLLDPQFCKTLNQKQTANGLVDMYVHILEQYLTFRTDGLVQDRQAEALLLSILDISEHLMKDISNTSYRAQSMWIAPQAVNGLINRGVPTDWSTHEIGHHLTILYDLAHAETLAIILFGVWNYCFEEKKDKLAQYGKRVWGLEGETETVARMAIEETEEFFKSLGLGTKLSDYNLDANEVCNAVSQNFSDIENLQLGENKNINIESVKEILISRK